MLLFCLLFWYSCYATYSISSGNSTNPASPSSSNLHQKNTPHPSILFPTNTQPLYASSFTPCFQCPSHGKRLHTPLPKRFLWIPSSLNTQLQRSTFLQASRPDPSTPLPFIPRLLPYLDADSSESPSLLRLVRYTQPDSSLSHAEDPISLRHRRVPR